MTITVNVNKCSFRFGPWIVIVVVAVVNDATVVIESIKGLLDFLGKR